MDWPWRSNPSVHQGLHFHTALSDLTLLQRPCWSSGDILFAFGSSKILRLEYLSVDCGRSG